VVDHCSTDASAPRRVGGVHRLQLRVSVTELLQGAKTEEFVTSAEGEERNGRVEQAVDVQRVAILGRAVLIREGQVARQQRSHVVGSWITDGDLALSHRQIVAQTRRLSRLF